MPSGGSSATGTGALAGSNVLQKIYDDAIAGGATAGAAIDTLRYSAMGQAAMNKGQAPEINVVVTLDGQEMAGAVTKVQTNNYLSNKIIQLERLESQFR
jgi:hypothetical protein